MWLWVLACSGTADDSTGGSSKDTDTTTTAYPRTVLLGDPGTSACIRDDLVADAAAEVQVYFDCVGCGTTVVSATCTVELDGSDVRVSGVAELLVGETPTSVTCTCASVEATCATPPLAAGGWSLVVEGASRAFTVPGDGRICAGP